MAKDVEPCGAEWIAEDVEPCRKEWMTEDVEQSIFRRHGSGTMCKQSGCQRT